MTDQREIRIVHGHGTGSLRRGLEKFLKDHPLVLKASPAPPNQGGGGATVVELKDSAGFCLPESRSIGQGGILG